jgi:hypothetical protein
LGPAEVDAYWAGQAIDSRSVFFRWQAVGDDDKLGKATSYQIRYREGFGNAIYEGPTWDAATEVPNTIEPGWAGAAESITVGGLTPGAWYYFAVRAVDEVGHVGPLQIYHYRIQTLLFDPPLYDTIAPAAITTLEAIEIDSTFATLRWTAPGDDGTNGTATIYRGRIATFPITDSTWDLALPIFWLPSPLPVGSTQTVDLGALVPAVTYYVALRAEDEVPNHGSIGNVVSFTTVYHEPLSVGDGSGLRDGAFAVGDVSPNPSTGPMSIRVETGSSLTVSVEVFDISGRIVCGPRFDTLGRGVGAIAWDGRDASGRRVPHGIYFVRVRGNDTSELRRVWVLP